MAKAGNRSVAKASGFKHYQSDSPCPKGHVGLRYVTDGSCFDCRLAVKKTKEQQRQANRRQIEKDPKAWRERGRRAYWVNPEKSRQTRRLYTQAHPEKTKAARIAYEAANPGWVLNKTRKRRARLINAEGSFTQSEIAQIRERQNDKCVYCGVCLSEKGHLDHKTPLARGGSNWPSNFQWLCQPCNSRKHAKTHEQYLSQLKQDKA